MIWGNSEITEVKKDNDPHKLDTAGHMLFEHDMKGVFIYTPHFLAPISTNLID